MYNSTLARVVVTGGRDYKHFENVASVLDIIGPREIYVGDCPTGVDRMVREYAKGTNKPLRVFSADWDRYGKAAGPKRNVEMLEAAGNALVIAFPGGRGTANCIHEAREQGMLVLKLEP